MPSCLPPSLTFLQHVQPQQQLNPPCVAAWWGGSCLWPLYAKCGISHQLASTDTPAVWGRLMPTRDTLLFSLPFSFSQSLSHALSVFLPLQPATQLIVCSVPPSSPSIAIPPSLSLLPEWQMWRGTWYGGSEGRGVCLSVCLCRWVWVGGAVQEPVLLALTSTSHPWPTLYCQHTHKHTQAYVYTH